MLTQELIKHIVCRLPEPFILVPFVAIPLVIILESEAPIILNLLGQKLLDLCTAVIDDMRSELFFLLRRRFGVLKYHISATAAIRALPRLARLGTRRSQHKLTVSAKSGMSRRELMSDDLPVHISLARLFAKLLQTCPRSS